eukprot:gnl/Hemi2/8751_TR3032_c1_g1_i1.p1 gnl/Hemi2/8751_TR3032_c1_g1~~gnl/Hemi2/8751_TR3032_c1_g1_i1.p1  ORF type:complete len:290 (-),score=19.94 gnl/Hemi2/8751_TR3032_c1_g1_i1:33-857(-)
MECDLACPPPRTDAGTLMNEGWRKLFAYRHALFRSGSLAELPVVCSSSRFPAGCGKSVEYPDEVTKWLVLPDVEYVIPPKSGKLTKLSRLTGQILWTIDTMDMYLFIILGPTPAWPFILCGGCGWSCLAVCASSGSSRRVSLCGLPVPMLCYAYSTLITNIDTRDGDTLVSSGFGVFRILSQLFVQKYRHIEVVWQYTAPFTDDPNRWLPVLTYYMDEDLLCVHERGSKQAMFLHGQTGKLSFSAQVPKYIARERLYNNNSCLVDLTGRPSLIE